MYTEIPNYYGIIINFTDFFTHDCLLSKNKNNDHKFNFKNNPYKIYKLTNELQNKSHPLSSTSLLSIRLIDYVFRIEIL